jgi:membrane protease YdiL (CAAX protease family)
MKQRRQSVRGFDVASAVQRYPTAAFFALAIGISWIAWIPLFLALPAATSLIMIPGAFGPAVAAGVVLRVRGRSIRGWFGNSLDWRIGKRWYLIALGLPVVVALGFASGFVVITGRVESSPLATSAMSYLPMVVTYAVVGGGQEEFGWRGYALPALQERYDALTASIVIGLGWATWHLPPFFFGIPGYTGSFLAYVVMVTGISVIMTWLYNNTGGSVLLAMLLHGGLNAAPNIGLAIIGQSSLSGVSPFLLLVVPVWGLALVLLGVYGSRTLAAGPPVTATTVEQAALTEARA